MKRAPLPPSLEPVFAVASARSAGASAFRMRAADLERPYRGIRAVVGSLERDTAEENVVARALAYSLGMTAHTFFSHVTAAALWGLPLPPSVTRSNEIDVAVYSPRRNPRGDGVRGHELDPTLASIRIHPRHGVPVTTPATTWATLGRILRNPYDLVAAGDALVRTPQHPLDPPALADMAELETSVAAGRRVGVNALRDALPRMRVGSSSRPETWTRLTLVDGGLPEPTLAFAAHSSTGSFIGRVDLAYPLLKIAIEYEGEQHRLDPVQWNLDILRYERLVADGWRVIRVTKAELFENPGALVARVRGALATAHR